MEFVWYTLNMVNHLTREAVMLIPALHFATPSNSTVKFFSRGKKVAIHQSFNVSWILPTHSDGRAWTPGRKKNMQMFNEAIERNF